MRNPLAGAALALSLGLGAIAGSADETPKATLERCWAEAANRTELAPCLERLLATAETALASALAQAEQQATELDRVVGERGRNAEWLAGSQTAWHAYRDAECARQGEAMAPGSGSGDVLLACRVTLTETRAAALDAP